MPSKSRGGSKRRHDGDTRDNTVTGVKAVTHDWEKDEEEVELEARLFGTSKKRKNPPAEYTLDLNGDGVGEGDGDGHEGELGGLDDSEVSLVSVIFAILVEIRRGSDDYSCSLLMRRLPFLPRTRTRMRNTE